MNILFLTLVDINSIEDRNIYTDLMREFIKHGHNVCIVSPNEHRKRLKTSITTGNNHKILKVKTGNIQKTNKIEKGISTIMIESHFKFAIKRFLKDVKFDLVMYSTPPITFAKVIDYIKKRDNTKSYLLLKDIFPQNAVDLGMLYKSSPIYKYFRKKEIALYKISDFIGCMSTANVEYLLSNNLFLDERFVHILPNSIDVSQNGCIIDEKIISFFRQKHGIPTDRRVFIYGGNLGKPQDIPFLIKCLKDNVKKTDRFFVICGSGTEYPTLDEFVNTNHPDNVLLINGLPIEEYEELTKACDIGLIFLDCRFTIPNFPSRLLSYMQVGMPVIACTDPNTDIGKVIEKGGFGWQCTSDKAENFTKVVDIACGEDLRQKSLNSRKYLEKYYSSEIGYKTIIDQIMK